MMLKMENFSLRGSFDWPVCVRLPWSRVLVCTPVNQRAEANKLFFLAFFGVFWRFLFKRSFCLQMKYISCTSVNDRRGHVWLFFGVAGSMESAHGAAGQQCVAKASVLSYEGSARAVRQRRCWSGSIARMYRHVPREGGPQRGEHGSGGLGELSSLFVHVRVGCFLEFRRN